MIIFDISFDFTGNTLREVIKEAQEGVIQAQREFYAEMLRDLLGPSGIPVVRGTSKGTFQDLAAELNVPIDWTIQPLIRERYDNEGILESDKHPFAQAEIAWTSSFKGVIDSALIVPESHFLRNEFVFPTDDDFPNAFQYITRAPENWDWQRKPPYGFFKGGAKEQYIKELRDKIEKIWGRAARRYKIKGTRYQAKSDGAIALRSLANAFNKPQGSDEVPF